MCQTSWPTNFFYEKELNAYDFLKPQFKLITKLTNCSNKVGSILSKALEHILECICSNDLTAACRTFSTGSHKAFVTIDTIEFTQVITSSSEVQCNIFVRPMQTPCLWIGRSDRIPFSNMGIMFSRILPSNFFSMSDRVASAHWGFSQISLVRNPKQQKEILKYC